MAATWSRCNLRAATAQQPTLIATLATNPAYLAEAERLATSAAAVVAGFRCAAVVISDEVRSAAHSPKLVPVLLAGRSEWRPPVEWCERKLSGWRHTSVLKLGALLLFLSSGVDTLFVDADWRLSRDPLASLTRCAHLRHLDVMGRRDDHFINLGLLYVRSTTAMLRIATRAANRSFVAWDQALFNEELRGANGLQCCVANEFFQSHFRRSEKVHAMKKRQQPRCAAARNGRQYAALPPPDLPAGGALGMWRGGWSGSHFNELTSAYHHRCIKCYNQCSRARCVLIDGGGADSCKVYDLAPDASSEASAPAVEPAVVPIVDLPAGGGTCTHRSGCCQRHPKACTERAPAGGLLPGAELSAKRPPSLARMGKVGACGPIFWGGPGPLCVGGDSVAARVDLGCRLPYNHPGLPDYVQLGTRRPIAASVQLPVSACAARTEAGTLAAPRMRLIVWRQSYPFNYMEFARRVLGEAPTLLSLARETSLIHVPLNGNLTLPSYYRALLRPFGTVVSRLEDYPRTASPASEGAAETSLHAGIEVSTATLCCVKKPTKLTNASAARVVIERIVAAHIGGSSQRAAGGDEGGGEATDVLFVRRAAPPWAGPSDGRRIMRLEQLVRSCRASGRVCDEVDFGLLPFGDAVRRLRGAKALVGAHGAGLTNAIFMSAKAEAAPLMVEVLPRAFATAARGFGLIKFGFLPGLGIRHARISAPEADPRCVSRASGLAERLRDCDVQLEWVDVERALRGQTQS